MFCDMRLEEVNALDEETAARTLQRCCGSSRWAQAMVRARPFASVAAMMDLGDAVWVSLDAADWFEAFAAHPRIGEPVSPKLADVDASEGGPSGPGGSSPSGLPTEALRAKVGWEGEEQSGARLADADARRRLAEGNGRYEARFGYIFIVCATGKSVEQMLEMLEARLKNDPHEELRIAAEEQRQITRLRLGKLLDEETGARHMITTHVLDTARGGPAVGITVILELRHHSEWSPIGRGATDESGRVTSLTTDKELVPGTYRLTFDTGTYLRDQGISMPFFPEAKITFYVHDPDEHYHVPLLLSPFGYSTYRGA
jgi:5-hydroxyisourate hydrolase / 2-oxo-4-hydroxy-4-carboxy-5-ureidoimidazoline decarboxylase